MKSSTVDFSAEFGGQDAANAVLVHFKALKAASRGLGLEGFPFPKLAFILRVDGEVTRYGFSGAGSLDIDRSGEYLSVDIGIEVNDRDQIVDVIAFAIVSSDELIKAVGESNFWSVDYQALRLYLNELVGRYKNEITARLANGID